MTKMSEKALLYTSLIFCVFSLCRASIGDEQPLYNHCVDECVQVTCPASLDYILTLLKWTCPENCRYVCMQAMTDRAIRNGLQVYQYYGKWPFYRSLGIQEPASVAFSIGNGLVHLYYYVQLKRLVPKGYFLNGFMILYTCIGMNAWLWSTIFHARDTKITELMDYFSAALLVLYTLFFALIRVYYIRNALVIKALGLFFICCFVTHVSYLVIVTFDYTYNIYANVIVGGLQVGVWVGWCLMQYLHPENSSRKSYAYLAVISGVGVSLAMCLELFDFPPLWRVFDAHSLWHLCTIPLSIVWYKFLMNDMWHETSIVKPDYTKLLSA